MSNHLSDDTDGNEHHTNCEYAKLNNYYKNGSLVFDVESEPTVAEFTDVIGEPMHLVARCVLNTPENFPYKLKKDGTRAKRQREYFEDIPSFLFSFERSLRSSSNGSWIGQKKLT